MLTENGRVVVKICGLREVEHALAAVEAGADLLGFVFAPSRRQISPAEAKRIVDQLPPGVLKVGVFVGEAPDVIDDVAALCRLDFVQLSGDEPPEACAALSLPVIKAIRTGSSGFLARVAAYRDVAAAFVLEGTQTGMQGCTGAYGGTGELCDWDLAAAAATKDPVLLAGGLTPENVGDAIAHVRPWGVDVSSGVEVGGRKDSDRIAAFVREARQASCQITPADLDRGRSR